MLEIKTVIFHHSLVMFSLIFGLIAVDKQKFSSHDFFIITIINIFLFILTMAFPQYNTFFIINYSIFLIFIIYQVYKYFLLKEMKMNKYEYIFCTIILIFITLCSTFNHQILNFYKIEIYNISKHISTIWTVHATSSAFVVMIMSFTININNESKYGIDYKDLKRNKNIKNYSNFNFFITLYFIGIQIFAYLSSNLGLSIALFLTNLFLIMLIGFICYDILVNKDSTNKYIEDEYKNEIDYFISELKKGNIINYSKEAEYDISILCDDITYNQDKQEFFEVADDFQLLCELICKLSDFEKLNTNISYLYVYLTTPTMHLMDYFERKCLFDYNFRLFTLLFKCYNEQNSYKFKRSVVINILSNISAKCYSGFAINQDARTSGIKQYTDFVRMILDGQFDTLYNELLFNHIYNTLTFISFFNISHYHYMIPDTILNEFSNTLMDITDSFSTLSNSLVINFNYDFIYYFLNKVEGKSTLLMHCHNAIFQKPNIKYKTILFGCIINLYIFNIECNKNQHNYNSQIDYYNEYSEKLVTIFSEIMINVDYIKLISEYVKMFNNHLTGHLIIRKTQKIYAFLFFIATRLKDKRTDEMLIQFIEDQNCKNTLEDLEEYYPCFVEIAEKSKILNITKYCFSYDEVVNSQKNIETKLQHKK